MSLDLVDRALTLSEPLTAPYYVVMAARLVHDQGLSVAPFVARLRSHPRIAELPAGSRRITEAAALALGGQPGPASCPLDVRDAVAALVWGRVPGDAVDPDVHALKTLIDEQWFEKLQLDEFAGAHGISRFALSRRFKRALGRSPRRYQQECRLGQAKRKLVETSWTITDIAYECGFVDAAQFSRLFKEATGVTPGQYRDLQT
jgi:AraC-like DNA-binding protein